MNSPVKKLVIAVAIGVCLLAGLNFVQTERFKRQAQAAATTGTTNAPSGSTNAPVASQPPAPAIESGSEDRIRVFTNNVSQIELSRDMANREVAELRKKIRALEDQLDSQNDHLERSVRVRPPTGSVRAERTISEPEKTQKRIKVPQLEYVWTTQEQVGSISLLPSEAATVRITGGVRFTIDPDPGLDIMVVLEDDTHSVAFAEWKKKPSPVRRFEISNNGDRPRIVLFTPE